jgi:hypothetical protein
VVEGDTVVDAAFTGQAIVLAVGATVVVAKINGADVVTQCETEEQLEN